MLVIGFTGFCVKPLRASGAMTLPELFEKRFGKRVRWLAGVVIVLGGLLNMGVFLKIGGDFLCAVCGWETGYLVPVMGGLLVLVAIYTILGGMLSVLITDFLQFIIMSVGTSRRNTADPSPHRVGATGGSGAGEHMAKEGLIRLRIRRWAGRISFSRSSATLPRP